VVVNNIPPIITNRAGIRVLSPQITEHKNITTYVDRNHGYGLGQAQPWGGGLNWLIGPKPLLVIIGSTKAPQLKPAQIRFHSKRPHTITNMNNINIVVSCEKVSRTA